MYTNFITGLGLPNWVTWFGPVLLLMIASAAWQIRSVRQTLAARAEADRRRDEVKMTGKAARATVLHNFDTGTRMGGDTQIVVGMRLNVQPDDGAAAFATHVEVPVSPLRLTDFAEGCEIAVRYDPSTYEVAIAQRLV